jgi:hypothetical protein
MWPLGLLFVNLLKRRFFRQCYKIKTKILAVSNIHRDMSMKDHNFHNYVHLTYPDELKMKNTMSELDISASYQDIKPIRLKTTLYDNVIILKTAIQLPFFM